MNLVDRYIYAVIRRLPPKQRGDIERELRGLIDDMLQSRAGEGPYEQEEIEAVLVELGHPGKLADNYRGSGRYLIGPDYFSIYWLVLRIVLGAVMLGITVAFLVRAATEPPAAAWQFLGDYLSSVFNAIMSAFGMVTLIFALNELFNHKLDSQARERLEAWKPADLPPVPVDSLRIKRGDSIVAMVFSVIFLLIVNVDIGLIGMYTNMGSEMVITPIFSDLFRSFLPWINLSLGIVIVLESIKLVVGRWNWPILAATGAQKVLSLLIGLRLFADPAIFSRSFFTRLDEVFQPAGVMVPENLPLTICRILTALIIFGFVMDALQLILKTVRLATSRQT